MQVKQLVSQLDLKKNDRTLARGQFDVVEFERMLRKEDETFWQKKGERKALALFHQAAIHVPAYRHFLKKNRVNPALIKTIEDFKKVPITDKKNYIQAYPLADRCWGGSLTDSSIIAASSGTSGEPAFWPRTTYQELESGVTHELIFRHLFEIDKYKTLMVICFPMGIYISGLATVLPSWLISTKKYNLTCITVGNNQTEALKAISSLQSRYEQVILVGHPFFIKDLIETGLKTGISWSKMLLRLMFCSGSFNETWRSYLMEKTGIKDPTRIISTYGSSEMLLIGHETPLSIMGRKLMEKNPSMRTLLHEPRLVPNVFQYNPMLRYIEEINHELIFTSSSGIPLIRFNLHDSGEIISLKDMKKKVTEAYPHWHDKIRTPWNLPFVTLYGRSDYTVKFYAANIYPEHIQIALNEKDFLGTLTGKFVMVKGYLKNMDEYLTINIELKPGIVATKTFIKRLQNRITRILKLINSEYADTSKHHPGKDLRPRIALWQYQDEKYFKVGLKPKFII